MTIIDLPEPWTARALCVQVDVGDVFYPVKGESAREAKKICHECEVKIECLQWALDHDEQFGVWGETSERERRALKRAGPVPTPPPVVRVKTNVLHGTRTRYQLGCRCDACVAANSAYTRRRRGRPLSLTPGAGL